MNPINKTRVGEQVAYKPQPVSQKLKTAEEDRKVGGLLRKSRESKFGRTVIRG